MMPFSIVFLNPFCMTLRSFSHHDSPVSHRFGSRQYSLGNTGENLPFLGFAALAMLLLFVCAILAGLTLAICSLDITRLHVLSMAGDQKKRNQALVISRIKRHASWFLCSMIICSVACAESIPIIIELLFGTGWLPIVVSTIAIAIFAELLPQYLIPRRAIIWGYYCWPFIWGCMWLTCIISWPLSYLLDTLSGPQADKGIYTLEQLEVLIKFHERAEKHGGLLGPDASRVMRGALHLDRQTIRGEFQHNFRKAKSPLADIETGGANGADILVPWSSVRCISINEEVTRELILRIKSWAYSRIPVVGDLEAGDQESADSCGSWNHRKVFGFLHVKNLVGLELPDHDLQPKTLFVKDLPLYPLPIVRDDMPLYDLLNVFQLGMARIALVIPTPTDDRLVPLSTSVRNLDALPRYEAPLWSVLTGLNARNIVEMVALDAHIDWTTDFLDAAQNEIEPRHHRKHSVIGIGCPKPIGIVTYEDILDALLQKTSLDEKDFFDRQDGNPPTKGRKEGDINSVSSNHSIVRTKKAVPLYTTKMHAAFERSGRGRDGNDGILRRRIISGPESGRSEETPDIICQRNIAGPDYDADGTGERTEQGFDGADERNVTVRIDVINDHSSYTENTLGGFHHENSRVELAHDFNFPPKDDAVEFKGLPTRSVSRPPEHQTVDDVERGCAADLGKIPSNSNHGAPTLLPGLRRVMPFSKHASMGYSREIYLTKGSHGTLDFHCEGTSGVVSDYSWNKPNIFPLTSSFHGIDSPEPAPATISNKIAAVDGSPQGNIAYSSKTVAKTGIPDDHTSLNIPQNGEIRLREESFHDDRTLLPSQRKRRDRKSQSGGRRISLWF